MLSLALSAFLAQGDVVVVDKTLSASWMWSADGVKARRSGPGAYDGLPVEEDEKRPKQAVVVLEVEEATESGTIHAGLAFQAGYKPVDCVRFREKGVLQVWVRGAEGGEDLQIGLYGQGKDGSRSIAVVSLSDFGKVTTEWTKVRIPVKEIEAKEPKFNLATASQVALRTMPGKSKLKLWFSDIRLTLK